MLARLKLFRTKPPTRWVRLSSVTSSGYAAQAAEANKKAVKLSDRKPDYQEHKEVYRMVQDLLSFAARAISLASAMTTLNI